MNISKHIFVITTLTVSCNALGMMGFGRELTKQQSSNTQRKEAQLTTLFLQYAEGKNQARGFELLSKGDMRDDKENKELDKMARCTNKYRRGLRKQEQRKAILLSSDPNRRRTL
jgi:hypothetical protein